MVRERESADDAAARWALMLDAGTVSPGDQAELDAWLAQSERHEGALLRARAILSYLDRGRALGAGAQIPPPAIDPPVAADTTRRRALFGMLATGLVAAGLGGIFLLPTSEPPLSPGGTRLRTALGEVRRVPLADGSIATINTESRLEIAMLPNVRRIRLENGEALFQVAHDAARPFVVEAGEVRVRAVGTAFSVRRRESGTDVLVTEGVVEAWVVGREAERRRIAAGNRSHIPDVAPRIEVAEATSEIDRTLAWRTGELVLNGETLGYAAAELNRYNAQKLVIDDPVLAREPLVGYFRTNEPRAFSHAVARMLDARMVETRAEIRLDRATR